MAIVKEWGNGDKVEFDDGRFDEWCVYIVRNGLTRRAPGDVEYFTRFQQLDHQHGAGLVLGFVRGIYQGVGQTIFTEALEEIATESAAFGADATDAEFWGTVLYATMVAEENRPLPLKKRVKMLGLHQLLVDNWAPSVAANWSRGKRASELDAECRRRGF